MSLVYYVTDTETNGLKAGFNEITEISIIRCSDRHQLTKKIKIDFPDRTNKIALEKTGRTYDDLLVGENKKAVVDICNAFFAQDGMTPEDRCLIAHNAAFDKRFCHALWGSVNKSFPAVHWMDTIKFAKEWSKAIGEAPDNFQLASVLKFAKITAMPGAHSAAPDARNTYLFWKKGMDNNIDYLNSIKREPHLTDGKV